MIDKSKRVTKRQLISLVFYEQGKKEKIQKSVMHDVFNCMLENISEAMVRGEVVEIRGFGKFLPIKHGFRKVDTYLNLPVKGKERMHIGYKFYREKCFRASKSLYRKVSLGGNDVFKSYFDSNSDYI